MLSINNVSKTYANAVQALNQVNLQVDSGMFGLLGPNGAGKSSLMRTLATLQQPDSGTIQLGDIDILAKPQQLRQVLGYLPQQFGAYPRISAQMMLDHFALLKGYTDKKARQAHVADLLQRVNLYQHRKQAVDTFSGGMKQRFGIAQALIGQPQLVIVDEPTAGLDPEERNRFHGLLADIGKDVVVILSTHIVDDVADLCSNMAILGNGEILLQGHPQQLIQDMQGNLWRKTIERAELAQVQQQFNVLSHRIYGGETIIHVQADQQPDPSFSAIEGGLEEVYFSTLAQHRISSAA